ncbi:uncharacterized protein LOC101741984 isoform X2 [Bombyx mori]|uniref:glycogenin glucosyltransferase n=1 Tax=Bombyx mori TaxID=7091 RepID=A0A8R2QW91_BOMMO|nr:uncharacterized protein LOC101741984 isoform X2 [Bombyx mori]XP_037866895.1 uncharacterized protein LOC101741984 isoform X2 [Bombyx mori]
MSNRAWVTLATNDSYGLGALVLAHSLRRAGSVYPAVALITPTVSEAMRDRLRAVFSEVVTVDVLDSRDAAHLALLQRPELGITFTKIHCWNLTQYEKCVFLDADILVIQNCDELFEREELSAAPDVGWPDCFNSGVFVFKPSNETFEKLIQFAQQRGSFDGGDQGLLNSFFSDWAHGDINKHLPFLYNVTTAAFYSYLPALKHYGQNLKIIHFIGAGKPWLQRFNWESRSVDAPGYLQEFLQLWWDLFVSQVHAQLDHSMVEVEASQQEPPEHPPALPPQDINQHLHYQPVLDPESEFPWHRPGNQIPDLNIEQYHEFSELPDPWDIYGGNIPPMADDVTSHHSVGDLQYHEELHRYAWEYRLQQENAQQATEHFPHAQSEDPFSLDHQHHYDYNKHHSHNSQHSELLHTVNNQLHDHNFQNNTQPSCDFTHQNYINNHNNTYVDIQPVHWHEEPSCPEYPQREHTQHCDQNQLRPVHHDHNVYQDYQQTHHQNLTHRVNSTNQAQYSENHYDHGQVTHNHQENFVPLQSNENSIHNNSIQIHQCHKTTHTIEHNTQNNKELPENDLASKKSYENLIDSCPRQSYEVRRLEEERNKDTVSSSQMNLENGLNDESSDENNDYVEDIRPRHPYDGFYLRHQVTIDSRGRKICTHEIPDMPSVPSESPEPQEYYSAEEAFSDSEDQSGVAGNLARVVLGSGTSTEAIDDLARRQGWEAGNIDYMGADSFDNIWAKISQTLSQPRTSPPKQLSPPKEVSPRQPTPEQVESENAEAIPETVTEAIPETVTKSIEDATVTVPTETTVEETPSQISATTNAPEVLPAVIDSDSVAVPEPAPVTSESLVAPVEVLAVRPVAIESEAIASAAVPTVTETPPSSDSTPTETEPVQKPETVPATETVTVDAGETVPLDVAESAPVALDEVAPEVPSEIKAADVIETASLPASESSPIVASETVLGITSEALSDVPLEIPVPVAELEQVPPTEVPTVVESETLAKPAEEPSIPLVADEPASVIPVPVEALATETELETKKESPKRLVESAKEKIETIAAATEPAAPEVPQTKSAVETIKDSTLAEPASPALAAEAPSSPAIPESTPEKPAAAGDSSTDSPPLANTPSKEEAPVVPAAKSTEEAAQETRL